MQRDQEAMDYAKVQKAMETKFNDYHVLVIPSGNMKEAIDIKVFNAKNINRVTFNELKEEVMKEVENLKKDKNG